MPREPVEVEPLEFEPTRNADEPAIYHEPHPKKPIRDFFSDLEDDDDDWRRY